MLNKLKIFKDNLYKYFEAKMELFKIDLQRNFEAVVVKLFYFLISTLLGFLILVFLFIVLAVFINGWLQSTYAGFLIVGGGLILLFLGWAMAKTWAQQLVKKLLYKIFNAR